MIIGLSFSRVLDSKLLSQSAGITACVRAVTLNAHLRSTRFPHKSKLPGPETAVRTQASLVRSALRCSENRRRLCLQANVAHMDPYVHAVSRTVWYMCNNDVKCSRRHWNQFEATFIA